MLVLSGQVKRADLKGNTGVRQLGPQELDLPEIVRSITKYAVRIMEPAGIRYHLEKAVCLARTGRKGPVWVEIPLDVQAAPVDPESLLAFAPENEIPPTIKQEELLDKTQQAIKLLNTAERPVLLVGNGVHHAGARGAFNQVVELLKIPVLTTWAGCDLIADNHPLCFGRPGNIAARGSNFTVQNSDCLISVGARLDFDITGFNQSNFARAAKKVVVDIDPNEIAKLRMQVQVPLAVDALQFFKAVLSQYSSIRQRDRSTWIARCRSWKKRYPVILPEYYQQTDLINSFVFADILSEELTCDDLLIPGSSGAAIDSFWMAFKAKTNQRAFSTGGLGSMGFGVPASLGGCLASGGRRTVTVEGDGGFHMNAQELGLVAKMHLPIKYFILNNQGYASIRGMQRNYFEGHFVGCDAASGLTLPDTVKVAEAYGVMGRRIASTVVLREQIREILAMPGPIVCEVMVNPDQVLCPRVSNSIQPDGSIVSKPLEDLWPFLDRQEFLENMIVPPLDE
jgi:acetolactate synthase-1/2/3 large subunit